MLNIFISHYHKEKEIAIALKKELIRIFNKAVNIFISPDIRAGEDWFNTVKSALDQKDIVIITLFSPYSVERPWINIESGYGIMNNKTVIPVCILGLELDDLPDPYRRPNAVRLNSNENAAYLLDRLSEHTEAKLKYSAEDPSVAKLLKNVQAAEYKIPKLISIPNKTPTVWIIGSHEESDRHDINDFITSLATGFIENNFRAVIAQSRLLNRIVNSIAENIQTTFENTAVSKKVLIPHPIVILGEFDSALGIKHIFSDAIGVIPDVCLILAGRALTKIEYESALQAGIPILPVPILGGFASGKDVKCTLHPGVIKQYNESFLPEHTPRQNAQSVLTLIQTHINLTYSQRQITHM